MSNMRNTILISAGIVASLPLIATGHFLYFGWRARRAQILSRFTNKSIKFYKETFCPEAKFDNTQQFEEEYTKRYGRHMFFLPVLLLAAALLLFSYLCTSWVFSHGWSAANDSPAAIAISSLAGADVWVTYDLILRARQNDMVTSDINRATLRLLVSLPFGFAIAVFAKALPENSGVTVTAPALAFFVGAFPTDAVLKFMRRTAGKLLNLDAGAGEEGIRQLTSLTGISTPIAERLIDEGIKTKLQLAYTDPITLTIRSGMDFAFILMCCSEALVRVNYDDDQIKIVQKFGLHTGFEIKSLNDALIRSDKTIRRAAKKGNTQPKFSAAQTRAREHLASFAKAMAMDESLARFTLDQIAEDPYTLFIWLMWPDTAENASKADNEGEDDEDTGSL